jgi:hypothetical protein
MLTPYPSAAERKAGIRLIRTLRLHAAQPDTAERRAVMVTSDGAGGSIIAEYVGPPEALLKFLFPQNNITIRRHDEPADEVLAEPKPEQPAYMKVHDLEAAQRSRSVA